MKNLVAIALLSTAIVSGAAYAQHGSACRSRCTGRDHCLLQVPKR